MLLNNEWVNNEIKEEIKRYLETNENENNNDPKSLGSVVLRGKFIAAQDYLKKQEKFQMNNLTYLKELEKEM